MAPLTAASGVDLRVLTRLALDQKPRNTGKRVHPGWVVVQGGIYVCFGAAGKMARVLVSSARGYPTWIMGCCFGKAVFRASTLSVLHSSYSSVVKLEYSVLSPSKKSNLSPFRTAGL